MAEYRFQLSGVTLPGASDLFGVWQVPPQTSGVSFGIGEPATPAEPTWRVSLPASPDEAQSILSEQERAIQRGESALAQAQERLTRLGQPGEGASFAAPSALASPEAELLSMLNVLQSPVSFGPESGEGVEQKQTNDRWKAFLEQISFMVSHYARVETEIAGALAGHTAIGWTGDFETVWTTGVTPPSMRLHHQSVHLALASRIALLRMVTVVGTGAASLALRLSIPGAQLLALPAACKFVRDVVSELRDWKEQA